MPSFVKRKVPFLLKLDKKQKKKQSLFPIRQKGEWGFISQSGEVVIKPKYKSIKTFSEGLAAVKDNNGKVGYIDESGRIVIKARFDDANFFHEQRAGISLNGKWGFIDRNGQIILSPELEAVGWFSEGRAGGRKNGLWGFINSSGIFVVQPRFLDYVAFSEGLAVVAIDKGDRVKTELIDRDGRIVAELENAEAFFTNGFSNGLLSVFEKHGLEFPVFWGRSPQKQSLTGFIDRSGKIAIPFRYEDISSFENCLASVKSNGKWGLINTTGEIVILPRYDQEFRFREGLAAVKLGSKYGFIDKAGNLVIQPHFSYASNFSENIAVIQFQEDRQWGFIDRTGKLAIQLKFNEQPSDFSSGLSLIRIGSKRGYINKTGQYVWTPTD